MHFVAAKLHRTSVETYFHFATVIFRSYLPKFSRSAKITWANFSEFLMAQIASRLTFVTRSYDTIILRDCAS